MKGMRHVAALSGVAFAVVCAAAGTVTFTEETGVIRNPGQGWSTMGGKWSFDQTDPVVNIGSVYCRFSWALLEPEEGRYDWRKLDELLVFAASKGLPASFRIMCASQHSSSGWPTPPWVFEKGAKDEPFLVPKVRRGVHTNVVHHTPVFDDPVFMAAHKRFVKALAARYDGDPRLAGLDLGSYGHWGEWHCGGLPPDTNRYVAAEARTKLKWVPPRKYPFEIRKQYADWYLESFKKTPVVFMTDDWEVLKYALGTGPTARVGLRRDGVASPWHFKRWIGTKPYDAIPRMGDVWKDRPVWFEFFGSGKSILEKGWDLPYAVEWMLTNHVSVVNTCPFNPWELKDSPYYPLLKKLDLYAGARLVPQGATVQRSGRRVTVSLSGVNKGVARIHLPYVAQVVVTDGTGREVMAHEADVDPGTWLPGPFRLADAFDLPPTAGGDLKLSVRLRHRHGIFRDFRFAARETAPDGSLPLGPALGGIDPVAFVQNAVARGEKTVTLPKGRYVIDTDDTVFFRLKGLDGVTIDFGGSELVCKKRTRYIDLDHCTNTVVRNVTLDMDPLPFSQGVIEKVLPDGAWEVRVLDDYAQPEERAGSDQAYRNVWPLQVYDRTTLETKNWMRAFNGFKMEAIGPCRFRVTGGGNRTGDVGDYCVWRSGETTRKAEVFGIHMEKCQDCRVENVTMYACWGVAFNEHFSSGGVWKGCRLVRRPPETDARKHSVPRLRSGAHDAFNSRMAGKGPHLENCSFAYHCDDCVNISGYYAVVTEVEGKTARILYKGKTRYGKLLFAGDTLEIMTPEGVSKPEHPRLLAVRDDAPQTPSELAWLRTLKLWPGQAEACTDGARVELDRPGLLAKGDLIIAENRQGNGWALVGCSFGPNRAYGIRIRASHGLVENCTFDRTEGEAAMVGPEYEWFEGGFGNDILFLNNRFIGYEGRTRVYVGGGAAYGKRIPASAHANVREE